MIMVYTGIEIRDSRKSLLFCTKRTLPTIANIERSRKKDKMVEASASMIELASVKREVTSPVRRVAKRTSAIRKYGGYRTGSHQS